MSLSYSQKDLEKRNRIIALVITVAINSILFFLIWQVKIWKESPTAIIQRLEESKTGEITFEPEPPAPEPEVQEEITENYSRQFQHGRARQFIARSGGAATAGPDLCWRAAAWGICGRKPLVRKIGHLAHALARSPEGLDGRRAHPA